MPFGVIILALINTDLKLTIVFHWKSFLDRILREIAWLHMACGLSGLYIRSSLIPEEIFDHNWVISEVSVKRF